MTEAVDLTPEYLRNVPLPLNPFRRIPQIRHLAGELAVSVGVNDDRLPHVFTRAALVGLAEITEAGKQLNENLENLNTAAQRLGQAARGIDESNRVIQEDTIKGE